MVSISEFIKESVFRPRLQGAGALVVYDPEQRYRQQCLDLADDKVRVVDASESSIQSRETAIVALRQVAIPADPPERLLVYVPAERPQTPERQQIDPFSIYAECGAVFPDGPRDAYEQICLAAKPDQVTAIRKLFAESVTPPTFAAIDAIGGGAGWPQLESTLNARSPVEILRAILAPSSDQSSALGATQNWVPEAKTFLESAIGLRLKTRGTSLNAVAEETWRFVLFSEFCFDLPGELPASLERVQRAHSAARPIIEATCEELRTNQCSRAAYVEAAERVEKELDLPSLCGEIEDLGEKDTFPFEERTFIRRTISAIATSQLGAAKQLVVKHRDSVWGNKGESQQQWNLVQSALDLVEVCGDLEARLGEHTRTQTDLIDFYLADLRRADRLQREFEQAVGEFVDHQQLLDSVVEQARSTYRRLAEKAQLAFTRHLDTSGWPPQGRLANAAVFDRFVGPRLRDTGRRVAYLMIDALRYELGLQLDDKLAKHGAVEFHAGYAQLPSITLIGMASLLPGAQDGLQLTNSGDGLSPMLAGQPVGDVRKRMAVLERAYGDRFMEMRLESFVKSNVAIPPGIDLLVLRNDEIDSLLESNPERALPLVPATLRAINGAVAKLKLAGFSEVVIATDHGFFLNGHADAGDVCAKPQGNWPVVAHDRLMLGIGSSDPSNLVIAADKLGIRGDFAQAAIPRSMAPYRSGHLYFHGGASLAEAIVPVIVVRLDGGAEEQGQTFSVELSYRNGAKRITTLLPVIEVHVAGQAGLFSDAKPVELLIEARDGERVVGEPRPGGGVDPATRTVSLLPGERKQVTLRMDDDFRGDFKVVALNPSTLALASKGSQLTLKTDYTE